jgi:hypothetical protein
MRHAKVSEAELERVETARSKWKYADLAEEKEITVLLFSKKFSVCMSSYPNFLVGITSAHDTIGIVDLYFEGELKRGEAIKVKPVELDEALKGLIGKPSVSVYFKPSDNDIQCAVKTVYYAEIKSQ